MSVPNSGTIEINQATRFSDFIRVDAGTTGNPIGGITWSSTDNGFLYANAGGVIKAKIDSANDSYLKPWGKEKALWNNLPIILHHADHMASRIEYEAWKSGSKIKSAFTKPRKTTLIKNRKQNRQN